MSELEINEGYEQFLDALTLEDPNCGDWMLAAFNAGVQFALEKK